MPLFGVEVSLKLFFIICRYSCLERIPGNDFGWTPRIKKKAIRDGPNCQTTVRKWSDSLAWTDSKFPTSRLGPPLQIKIKTTFSRSFVHIRFEYNKIYLGICSFVPTRNFAMRSKDIEIQNVILPSRNIEPSTLDCVSKQACHQLTTHELEFIQVWKLYFSHEIRELSNQEKGRGEIIYFYDNT